MRPLFFIFTLLWVTVFAQQISPVQLGDSTVKLIKENTSSKSTVLFINVHENEATSIEAYRAFDTNKCFPFFYIQQNNLRRIFFNYRSHIFSVDPNRIFTPEGVLASLEGETRFALKASRMVKKMASEILKNLANYQWIISLHNNTPDNYSILSYLPDSSEAVNTKSLFINEAMDPDDFIYTTDLKLFEQLQNLKINAILQDNENCFNDGSLSVYCGKKGIAYANIEAEEGHLKEQIELLKIIIQLIKNAE